ncbi:putative leucine-rich repeat domain, L domain-containing protein [Rosa chinensis]|uniref:Putative leucine-rich repeat domain, L domain-containing protein n=1 Tax=Rosa chinensis TaxID=74649 RepID=A0A2P6PV44_ROSCH|nr:putative leucine-rich repeat domain, L domain-containing protein [Rosa chinensis]
MRLPTSICKLKSLQRLSLFGCCKFKDFPEILEPMERLEFLNLSKTAIEELPMSTENLVGLKMLELSNCKNLRFVPSSIYKIKSVVLDGCRKLHFLKLERDLSFGFRIITETLEPMERLEFLNLSKTLELFNCKNLRFVPGKSKTVVLDGCWKHSFFKLERGLSFRELPRLTENLVGLRKLELFLSLTSEDDSEDDFLSLTSEDDSEDDFWMTFCP